VSIFSIHNAGVRVLSTAFGIVGWLSPWRELHNTTRVLGHSYQSRPWNKRLPVWFLHGFRQSLPELKYLAIFAAERDVFCVARLLQQKHPQ